MIKSISFRNPFYIKGLAANATNQMLGFGGSNLNIDQRNRSFPYEDGYAKSSDLYAIVNKIARNAKEIPWIIEKKIGDNIEQITKGALFNLINEPNKKQSRKEYVESAIADLLLSGNIYFWNQKSVGYGIAETHTLHPQLVEIVTKYDGFINEANRYEYHIDGRTFKIDSEDITHTKYNNPTNYGIDSLYGLSPMVAGYLTLIGLNNNNTASASILEHQGAAGILSNESDYPLNSDEQKDQQRLFDNKAKGMLNFGKIIQSMAKVKYTKLGLDPTQLKIIESKTMKMRDLCNIYDISSVLFNDPQNRIQANLVPAERSFWANAVIPNANLFLQGYNQSVVSKFNKKDFPNGQSKYVVRLDTSGILALQADSEKAASKAKSNSEALTNVLISDMTPEQKVQTLVYSFDMDEQEAKQIVGS